MRASLVLMLGAAYTTTSQASVPPRVRADARDFGGGLGDLEQGHGQTMQRALHRSALPIAELSEAPTWADFYQNYVRTNRPVVIRNHAREQPAFKLWTDQYLSKTWGSRLVNVEIQKVEERGGPTTRMTFADFLSEIYTTERKDELYAIVDFENDKKAKRDFWMPTPLTCEEIVPQSYTLWISAGGTSSVLHQDDADNFLMLLDGKKRVMLIHQDQANAVYAHIAERAGTSPVRQDFVDLQAFPRFAKVPWISAELRPGDTLFIPHSYWHQVESEGRNVALNLWWGHKADWEWWTSHDWRPDVLGTPGHPSFDDLRAKSSLMMPCSLLPNNTDLNKVKFMDEDQWKQYVGKKQDRKSVV